VQVYTHLYAVIVHLGFTYGRCVTSVTIHSSKRSVNRIVPPGTVCGHDPDLVEEIISYTNV